MPKRKTAPFMSRYIIDKFEKKNQLKFFTYNSQARTPFVQRFGVVSFASISSMNLMYSYLTPSGGILRTSLLPMVITTTWSRKSPTEQTLSKRTKKIKTVFPNNILKKKKYAHNISACGWRTGRCGACDGQNGSSQRLRCTRVRDAPRRQHVWRRLRRTPIPTGPVRGSVGVESCARARNDYRLAGRAELPEPLTTRVPVAGPPRNPRPFGFYIILN